MVIIENRSYFDTLDDEVGRLIKNIDGRQKQMEYRQAKADLFSTPLDMARRCSDSGKSGCP